MALILCIACILSFFLGYVTITENEVSGASLLIVASILLVGTVIVDTVNIYLLKKKLK